MSIVQLDNRRWQAMRARYCRQSTYQARSDINRQVKLYPQLHLLVCIPSSYWKHEPEVDADTKVGGQQQEAIRKQNRPSTSQLTGNSANHPLGVALKLVPTDSRFSSHPAIPLHSTQPPTHPTQCLLCTCTSSARTPPTQAHAVTLSALM